MTVRQVTTTYVCDGCGYETSSPHNWRQMNYLGSGNTYVLVSTSDTGRHYCPTCVGKMLGALPAPAVAAA